MESSVLAQLLRLPPGDRADLAMALWESLSDDEREGELALSPEQRAELDRRWADHQKRPDNVVPWSDVRRKLLAGECSRMDTETNDPACVLIHDHKDPVGP